MKSSCPAMVVFSPHISAIHLKNQWIYLHNILSWFSNHTDIVFVTVTHLISF